MEYPFATSWMLRAEIETFDLNAHFANISIAYWFGKTRYYQAAKEKPVALEAAVVEETPSVKNLIAVPVLEVVMLTDNDQDGVYSDKDICPDTPLGITVNDVGCAVFQGKLAGIHFDSDSSELKVAIYGYLDKAVSALKQYDLIKIEIQAYTDSQGDASYNLALSNRRAESVMYYMINKGIDASRLIATGYGEENPIASNEDATGRAKNRRVEFKVIQ